MFSASGQGALLSLVMAKRSSCHQISLSSCLTH